MRVKRESAEEMDEVARLLALQIRLTVGSQSQAIVELERAGLRPSRIADLLGTSVGTVNVTLQRSRKTKNREGA